MLKCAFFRLQICRILNKWYPEVANASGFSGTFYDKNGSRTGSFYALASILYSVVELWSWMGGTLVREARNGRNSNKIRAIAQDVEFGFVQEIWKIWTRVKSEFKTPFEGFCLEENNFYFLAVFEGIFDVTNSFAESVRIKGPTVIKEDVSKRKSATLGTKELIVTDTWVEVRAPYFAAWLPFWSHFAAS